MSIYKPALERMSQAKVTGATCAALFEVLSQKLLETGATSGEFKLGYIPANTPPEQMPRDGEFIPEIILRLS